MEFVSIHSDFIKLDALLKTAALVGTGGEAKIRIQQGEVQVNGAVCLQRGKKLYPGDIAQIENQQVQVKKDAT